MKSPYRPRKRIEVVMFMVGLLGAAGLHGLAHGYLLELLCLCGVEKSS